MFERKYFLPSYSHGSSHPQLFTFPVVYIVVYYSLFADGTILKFLMRDLRQDLSCELLVLKLKSIDRRAPPGVEPVT